MISGGLFVARRQCWSGQLLVKSTVSPRPVQAWYAASLQDITNCYVGRLVTRPKAENGVQKK